jgi:O-antigen biosynthesis protein
MDISIIIVNYNVRQFLENALTSLLRALEGMRGEILVVDNASDDGSVEMVREKFPGVRLIVNATNVGFARANNAALREATGRYLLLINPDTIVQEDTLQVMTEFLERNPDVGLAGCTILNPDGTLQLACRRSFPTPWVAFTKIAGLSSLFPRSRWFGRYNLTYLPPEETYEVEAISGSFMMMTRAAFAKVGGLDEMFFMYGEDLDWCYRVRQAGFKVFYVHRTKIIHYKGESTRRSDIDEIRVFYHAMQQFVEKHFSRSVAVEMFLTLGILLRAGAAFAAKASPPFLMAAADVVAVVLSLIAAEVLYFGQMFHFPSYAYPVVWSVPPLIVIASLYLSGVYTVHRYSASKTVVAVIAAYVVLSAVVFFAKEFAFSRAVVLISGAGTLLLLPGWRLLLRAVGGRGPGMETRRSLFGRRTVIVGTGPSSEHLLRKLRARVDGGYDVLGFIDVTRRRVGEKVGGVEILGSLDNVGKVIDEYRIGEVIFSTDGISYGDILSVIARSTNRGVNFRMVPNSLEAIIGKTSIDELNTLPLVEIEYNLQKPLNRFMKRVVDIAVAGILLVTVYPWVRLFGSRTGPGAPPGRSGAVLLLPQVFSGRLTLVGFPRARSKSAAPIGKPGLTGLVQTMRPEELAPEEMEKYLLYYAKNQSLLLDLEIMAKALLRSRSR